MPDDFTTAEQDNFVVEELEIGTRPPDVDSLPFRRKLGFGLGSGAFSIATTTVSFFLNAFLLEVALVPPAQVGVILMVGRVWDGLVDPFVGYLCDRTDTRFGRRRPWMIAAALPSATLFFFLWRPPVPPGTYRFLYYLLMYCSLNTAIGCFFIPYTTLQSEMGRNDRERNALLKYRQFCNLLFLLTAATVFGALIGKYSDEQEGKRGYELGSMFGTALVVLCPIICVSLVTELPREQRTVPDSMGFLNGLKVALKDKGFVWLTMAYLCAWMGVCFVQNTMLLFVSIVWDATEAFTFLLVPTLAIAALALPFWAAIIHRLGKKLSFALSLSIMCIGVVILGTFKERPPSGYLIAVAVVIGLGFGGAYFFPWSMLADVIALDTARTGQTRQGMWFSYFVFFQKFGVGLALAIINMGLHFAGYNAKTGDDDDDEDPEPVPDSVVMCLRMLVSAAPVVGVLLSLFCIWRYPVDSAVVAELQFAHHNSRSVRKRRRAKSVAVRKRKPVDSTTALLHTDEYVEEDPSADPLTGRPFSPSTSGTSLEHAALDHDPTI
ncbi:MAG: hypothetical protein MHM6MM_003115 [Cercozoa sp. M6MM]